MKDLKIWLDTFDIIDLKGDIKLIMYDKRTHDFMITIKRAGLRINSSFPLQDTKEWLTDLPIVVLEINNHKIIPTWKPNKYGQPADINEFQHIRYTATEINISVHANGTPEEVFNRYNPYNIAGTDETRMLTYTNEYYRYDDYQHHSRNINEKYSKHLDANITSHMFE